MDYLVYVIDVGKVHKCVLLILAISARFIIGVSWKVSFEVVFWISVKILPLFSMVSESMNITRANMPPVMVQATSVHFLSFSDLVVEIP